MHKINEDEAQEAHRHSLKLWCPDAEVLSVVPGKELGESTLAA